MTTDVIDTATNTRPATIYTGPGTIDANAEISGGVGNLTTCNWTGSGNAVQVNVGFHPRRVFLMNMTDNISFEWITGMAATDTVKTVAAGTRIIDTTSAIVPTADAAGNDTIAIPASAAPSTKLLVLTIQG